EERMERPAAAKHRSLHVVDRVLATEDEDEEQRGKAPRSTDDAARAEAVPEAEARDVEPGAIHELLEHERMLPLLDHLVVNVAELGRAVRQRPGELEQPALEHVLELSSDLHLGRDQVQTEAGTD